MADQQSQAVSHHVEGYPPAGYPIPLQQEPPAPLKPASKWKLGSKNRTQTRDGRDKGCIEGCLAALCCCCVLEECCG